jgi:uncharacterized protein
MKLEGGRLRLAASDVANFLACSHLTRLDMLSARGQLRAPYECDAGFQDLVARGEAHERAVLDGFAARGWSVCEIAYQPGDDAAAAQATLAAISSGVDVVYQGVLLAEQDGGPALFGRPDFLARAGLLPAPDSEPLPDGLHYEVVDAKLARTAKARAVAQVGFYSDLLARAQRVQPRWMHLALGGGAFTTLKVSDYAAYGRQSRRRLAEVVADEAGPVPYPEPVEHCAICRWSRRCTERRRGDDDLSLIAGMAAGQRRRLKAAGVATRRGFAALDELPLLRGVNRESLAGVQLQARLQVASEDTGVIQYEVLSPERDGSGELVPNRGLLALPEPVTGDLFFDIEGARYYSEDGKEFGLQYLFGIIDTADVDDSGTPRYSQIWSFDRSGEKRAFEELVDFITARRERVPRLHVYHYNHYEPTSVDHLTELHETRQEAVGRLMGRFATREDEVDDLFRRGVFVDLYRVVRQGIRAGVESYSIKRLEPLCGYARRVDLRVATEGLIAFEAGLEDGSAPGDVVRQQVIAGYNEDDCRATLVLRDWLESRRAELAEQLEVADLPRPIAVAEVAPVEDPELARIKAELLASVPSEAAVRSAEQGAKALLADLLEWHRREDKPAWWRYFYLRGLGPAELIEEPDALGGLTGGAVVRELKRSVVRRFAYPPQEHRFGVGDTALDSATEKGWAVLAVDDARGEIELKIGKRYDGPLPTALVPQGPIQTLAQRERLRELGERVARDGVSGQDAATALLLRSRVADGGRPGAPLRLPGEAATAAARRLVLELRDSYLPTQGPPGTGKTFNAADQVLELVALGRTVGITGPSHAVICNLIDKVCEHASIRGTTPPRIGQRADKDNPHLHPAAQSLAIPNLEKGLRDGGLDVVAGTSWLWAREQFARSVDVLFVDEAGQLPLADVLAVAHAAGTLVLLGDPQQLAQPSDVAHPPGAGASALEHVLGAHATMPADAGLLLDQTWRMHPRLCRYTSEVFYDGRLTAVAGLERQEILGEGLLSGTGLRVVEVPHEGNTNASPEESARVAILVRDLLGSRWRDKDGAERAVGSADVLVITPYNAQIRAIREALVAVGCPAGVQVGTVDKFQGREAAVAIYSMATSSAQDAPRGLEFLYDPRRLNVATSRARAMAIIVASPQLVQASCNTVRQMSLVNALCRAWEWRPTCGRC